MTAIFILTVNFINLVHLSE